MRTHPSWLCAAILCATAIAVPVAGCTREGGAARPDPSGGAVHPGSSVIAAGPGAGDAGLEVADAGPIVAWTDPQAIRELARSCAFKPKAPTGEEDRYRREPLSCRLQFEQACVADPCLHEDQAQCQEACAATCEGCGASCVTSCDGCKKSCKDDACRTQCATSCGRCRQECLTTRDRCTSAHCTEVYSRCRKTLVSTWIAKGCDAVCTRCNQKCPNGDCDCWEKGPVASACHANPMLCPEMNAAPERREVDPAWKANHCDDACARIWACAKSACDNSTDCGEPVKKYESCSRRVAGANACKLGGLDGMMRCPEPQQDAP